MYYHDTINFLIQSELFAYRRPERTRYNIDRYPGEYIYEYIYPEDDQEYIYEYIYPEDDQEYLYLRPYVSSPEHIEVYEPEYIELYENENDIETDRYLGIDDRILSYINPNYNNPKYNVHQYSSITSEDFGTNKFADSLGAHSSRFGIAGGLLSSSQQGNKKSSDDDEVERPKRRKKTASKKSKSRKKLKKREKDEEEEQEEEGNANDEGNDGEGININRARQKYRKSQHAKSESLIYSTESPDSREIVQVQLRSRRTKIDSEYHNES